MSVIIVFMKFRCLAIEPKLLILHGPTVGVDVGSKDTIYRIIQSLTASGLGVIIISDDLRELLQNCDRILVMNKGHLTKTFPAENVSEQALYEALTSEHDPKICSFSPSNPSNRFQELLQKKAENLQ